MRVIQCFAHCSSSVEILGCAVDGGGGYRSRQGHDWVTYRLPVWKDKTHTYTYVNLAE